MLGYAGGTSLWKDRLLVWIDDKDLKLYQG